MHREGNFLSGSATSHRLYKQSRLLTRTRPGESHFSTLCFVCYTIRNTTLCYGNKRILGLPGRTYLVNVAPVAISINAMSLYF